MRIALAQMFSEWGAANKNLSSSRRYIRQARSAGADLVVFPETSAHGIWKDPMVRLVAESLEGPIVDQMRAWARRHRIAIGFGMAERTAGKPYNTYVLVDKRGEVAGVHRKNFVTSLESEFFRRDRRRPVSGVLGVKMAVGICADNCNAALLAGYARRRVDLVLMPHAWDADPILKDGSIPAFPSMAKLVETYAKGLVVRYRNHNEMLKKFRKRVCADAARYGFHTVFVNNTGVPHPLIPSVGPSFVAGPTGEILARTRSKKEQILVADIDV